MQRDRDTRLDRDKPALIVTYGNTPRKVRPLDRSVVMLGAAPGCDVQLKSKDIFPVHSLVVQIPEGWRVRDVTGRGATRLNGHIIQDELLHDGDVIQIGTFSFQLHLPAVAPGSLIDNHSQARSGNSLFDDEVEEPARGQASPDEQHTLWRFQRSRQKLGRLAWTFRRRLRECQGLLEQREREQEAHQRDITRLLSELKTRAQQFRPTHAQPNLETSPSTEEATETESVRRLSMRAAELNHYASHLRRCRDRLGTELPGSVEMEKLRRRVQELEERTRTGDTATKHEIGRLQTLVNSLRAERDRVQEQLTALFHDQESWQEERLSVLARQEELMASARRLRQELDERTVAAETLEQQVTYLSTQLQDQRDFEAELNAYRLELERDQAALNDQHAELGFRDQELERSRRNLETQMAREKTQLIRERGELTRLREELVAEQELSRSDSGVREWIAILQKKKDELANKRQATLCPPSTADTVADQ